MNGIVDIRRAPAVGTKLKVFQVPFSGTFRLSRSDGEVERVTIGNCGLYPYLRIFDSIRDIFRCPNVFMTGSFPLHAGYSGELLVEAYCSESSLIPQLSITWRDDE